MPENLGKRTGESASAMDAYARSVESAINSQRTLTQEMSKFTKVLGPSGVSRGMSQFTRGVTSAVSKLAAFKGATVSQQIALQGYASTVTATVTAMLAFLDVMDRIEKKQGALQRTYGLANVSMQSYYKELAQSAKMGGRAGVDAAESVISAMLSQRRVDTENRAQLRLTAQEFMKYTLSLSQNFPKDLIRMQQELGLNIEEAGNAYKTLGYNAATARVPFEQYKDSIFAVSGQFVNLGVRIQEVTGFFNLFMDDVSSGKLTMREAQEATSKLLDVMYKGGQWQQRAIISRMVSEEFENLPPGIQQRLNQIAQEGAGKQFQELSTLEVNTALRRLYEQEPEMYGQVLPAMQRWITRRTGKEGMAAEELAMVVAPMITPFELRQLGRLGAGAATGRAGETVEDFAAAMQTGNIAVKQSLIDFTAQIDKNTGLYAEWYAWFAQWIFEAKASLSNLQGGWKVLATGGIGALGLGGGLLGGGGGAGGGAGNLLMTLAAGRYLGLGGPLGAMGTGALTAGRVGIGAGAGLGGMATVGAIIAPVVTAVIAAGAIALAVHEINKAGGFGKLWEDVKYNVGGARQFLGTMREFVGAEANIGGGRISGAGVDAWSLIRGGLKEAMMPTTTEEYREMAFKSIESLYKTGGFGDVGGMSAGKFVDVLRKEAEAHPGGRAEDVIRIVLDMSPDLKARVVDESVGEVGRKMRFDFDREPRSSIY